MIVRLLAITTAFTVALATAASAATVALEIIPASPRVNDTVTVKVTGSIEDNGALWVYKEPNGGDCATYQGDHSSRVATSSIDLRFPDPNVPFVYSPQTTFDQATTYRLCAYLYRLMDNEDNQPPRALATALVTVQPPPPPPDRDGDGVADSSDTCPDVAGTSNGCPADTDRDGVLDGSDQCAAVAGAAPTGCPAPRAPVLSGSTKQRVGSGTYSVQVSCDQACQIRATGKVDGIPFRVATDAGAAFQGRTLKLKFTSANLKKLRAKLKKRKSVTGTITVSVTSLGGTASTVRKVTVAR